MVLHSTQIWEYSSNYSMVKMGLVNYFVKTSGLNWREMYTLQGKCLNWLRLLSYYKINWQNINGYCSVSYYDRWMLQRLVSNCHLLHVKQYPLWVLVLQFRWLLRLICFFAIHVSFFYTASSVSGIKIIWISWRRFECTRSQQLTKNNHIDRFVYGSPFP